MNRETYIPALTGVRALAAFAVFFHHYNRTSFPYFVFRVLNDCHIGVTLMFVLSGFLICYRYFDTFNLPNFEYRTYARNRVARIYPMYLIITLLTFIVAYFNNNTEVYNHLPNHWTIILLNITFLRGFFDQLKFTGLGQGWSLTAEECFYFLAPIFFIQIRKTKFALVFLPITIMLIGIVLTAICSAFPFWGFFGNIKFLLIYTFGGRCVDFFMGIGLALVLLKTVPKHNSSPLYTTVGLTTIAVGVSIMALVPLTNTIKFGFYQPWGMFANNIILPIGASLFLYGLIRERSWFVIILSTKLIQTLGKASYTFYLIHIGFIALPISTFVNSVMENFTNWLDEHNFLLLNTLLNHTSINIIVIFTILNIIAYFIWRFIEVPMYQFIKKSAFLTPATPKTAK